LIENNRIFKKKYSFELLLLELNSSVKISDSPSMKLNIMKQQSGKLEEAVTTIGHQ
jgi:hypothetical protein